MQNEFALHLFFGISLFLISVFLILLVLVQRGRGGGIAGALGGAGGQSAFGTKAGDLFTRITVGVAAVWILMCCLAIFYLKGKAFTTGVSQRAPNASEISGDGGQLSEPTSSGTSAPASSQTGAEVQPSADEPPAGGQTPAAEEQPSSNPPADAPASQTPANQPSADQPAEAASTSPTPSE